MPYAPKVEATGNNSNKNNNKGAFQRHDMSKWNFTNSDQIALYY
jgi:hypothetical protein